MPPQFKSVGNKSEVSQVRPKVLTQAAGLGHNRIYCYVGLVYVVGISCARYLVAETKLRAIQSNQLF